VEYSIFKNTDVVGDAHYLPFKDQTFDLAVALNVFEHLREPHVAAAELRRVLTPGGKVFIHTAFLQPLHEAPHHYYGATEFGVRQWFCDFADVQVSVSGNFHPYIGLSWMVSDLLWQVGSHLGSEARQTIERMTLGEIAEFWMKRQHGDAEAWQVLSQLPEAVQRRSAAGFQLEATKPQ
jgi:ubiquinone/menaquinone biosynthesis C-methylase UbiE